MRWAFRKLKIHRGYLWTYLALNLAILLSVFIPPSTFWPSVLMSYAIPGILSFNIFLFILLAIFRFKAAICPLVIILAGLPFFGLSYQFSFTEKEPPEALSILSYNVKLFRKVNNYSQFSSELIQWVSENPADILCLQEYSTNNRWPALDITGKIKKQGFYGFVHSPAYKELGDHNPGVAIFSRYPILNTGVVWENPYSINLGIFADIKKGNDTIRVYSVHMESMKLNPEEYKKPGNYWKKVKYLISIMKKTAVKRQSQTEALMIHTKECPYPFVIAGDFNETPYGYNYTKLRSRLSNAYESRGNGFGFTTNNTLFFLRIDHQFFSEDLECNRFEVDRTIGISDHFPVFGYYSID